MIIDDHMRKSELYFILVMTTLILLVTFTSAWIVIKKPWKDCYCKEITL